MEEPDRDVAHVVGVENNGKKNEVFTASHSSEDSDSWTLLGKDNVLAKGEPSGVQEAIKEEVVEKGKSQPPRKQRHDSHRSTDSQLDESSDGIIIISESDGSSLDFEEDSHDDQGGTVHFSRRIDLKKAGYEPLTPPFTPDEVKLVKEESIEKKQELQVKQPEEHSIEPVRSVVEHYDHTPVSNTKWVIFSLIATGMVAVILGNSMRLQNRVDEINFEHEKRISELELENNILKNEMNKLRHLYTRSELDEQVQRAEFEWNLENVNEAIQEPMQPPAEDKATDGTDGPAQLPMRKVPPQDSGVKRKVVWSGDEEEPMLIVDKDFVLPAFCYNQDQAVHDDLFSEYSAKYCDVKKRKIEAKQKKVEYQQKKQPKQENYNKFINQQTMEPTQEKRPDPNKPASPFNIDYQKAFDAIKAEGSVIVEALGSILDLSPEPEYREEAQVQQVATPLPVAPDVPDVSTDQSSFVPKEKDGMLNRELPENRKPQKHDDNKRRKHQSEENDMQRKEDKFRSSEEYKHKQSKDGRRHEDQRKNKSGSEKNGKYDGKERKKEHGSHEHNKYVEDNGSRNGPKERHEDDRKQKHYQDRKNYRHRSGDREDDDDDDDEDDHYKKKFDQREPLKDRNHHGKPYDQHSGEGSYLEQYKRAEWKKEKGYHSGENYHDHDKQHGYKQHKNHKNGDWNEKRYKGRNEYRQNGGKHGDRGSGEQHWQERMKHGRREARDEQRKQMEQENNWYLERGNQREEERIFHHTDGGPR